MKIAFLLSKKAINYLSFGKGCTIAFMLISYRPKVIDLYVKYIFKTKKYICSVIHLYVICKPNTLYT